MQFKELLVIPLQGTKALLPTYLISLLPIIHIFFFGVFQKECTLFSFQLWQTTLKERIISNSSFLARTLTSPGTKSRVGVDHHVPNFVFNYMNQKFIFPKLNRFLQILISKNIRTPPKSHRASFDKSCHVSKSFSLLHFSVKQQITDFESC